MFTECSSLSSRDKTCVVRLRVRVRGIVQGVGFRPFVYRLAKKHRLCGYVLNDTAGVLIEIQGRCEDIGKFLSALRSGPPPLASIEEVKTEEVKPYSSSADFVIAESQHNRREFVAVSPDIATCDKCLSELLNKSDRRYHYPFLNCTDCGPRFSIVEDVPYDRAQTTMKTFPMCPDCKREYEDPLNRRFHAQPNACSQCGPHLMLTDNRGRPLPHEDVIATTAGLVVEGRIVAVKGLGGYHLCCDATSEEAVQRLRERKHRIGKPFALMMRDLKQVREHCLVTPHEECALTSPARPIVLLRRRQGCTLPEEIAPCNNYLGIMLPYTPVHHLLCRVINRPLVMTSGNVSDEPIAYTDKDAYNRLASIAEVFLLHNRGINTRVDDSVVAYVEDKILTLRRSRGYAPQPFALGQGRSISLLAVGGHSKNTFCFVRDGEAVVSHHIGDLENLEATTAFEESIEHYQRLFRCRQPTLVVCDLHPGYASTRFAYSYAAKNCIPVHKVQHHHAHIAAVLGEHRLEGEVIGVAFDGSGYGDDGTVWGGEFLIASQHSYRRVGTFQRVGLPGGEAAVREPWRMGLSYLYELYGAGIPNRACKLILDMVESRQFLLTVRLLSKDLYCPRTSSVGRLFDAVASLMGVRAVARYEGQAAVELEQLARVDGTGAYRCNIVQDRGLMVAHTLPMIEQLLEGLYRGECIEELAGKLHNTLASVTLQMCTAVRERYGLDRVALAGGVFQNRVLLTLVTELLLNHGFVVYRPHIFPPGDGGLSLGQAVVGCNFLDDPSRSEHPARALKG